MTDRHLDCARLSDPFGRSTLVTVCAAALVLPLSFSGGAIATPAIGQDLGGSPLAMNWITNAFMLSFGSFLMAAGTLADTFGRKRIFKIGMAGFTLVSLLLAWAPNITCLDVMRSVQGVAAAAALSGGSAALAQSFEGSRRLRAFSWLGTSFGVGLAVGPFLAGCLVDRYGWRSAFLPGAVVGASVLLWGMRWMGESRDPDAMGLDWLGTLTFTGTLALFTWGVLQTPVSGASSPLVISLLSVSAALLIVFVAVEQRARRPMLDLSLFRYPRFVGVQVLPLATCYCYVVLLVLLPIRFIGIEGCSEIAAGVAMIALSAPMLFAPSMATLLTRRFSPGGIATTGLIIAALGLFLLSRVVAGHAAREAILPMLIIGIGTGLPWGLMDGLSVSVVPKERAGMATGIFSTTRVAGEGIALASVSAILFRLIQSRLFHSLALANIDRRDLSDIAQHLAIGDLAHALTVVPGVRSSLLADVYTDAFRVLVYLLITITLLAVLVVCACLGVGRTSMADSNRDRELATRQDSCNP